MSEKPDLISAFVDMANSIGEDFNDGDEFPGWMTAEWREDGSGEVTILEVTYRNPEGEEITQRFGVLEIED